MIGHRPQFVTHFPDQVKYFFHLKLEAQLDEVDRFPMYWCCSPQKISDHIIIIIIIINNAK